MSKLKTKEEIVDWLSKIQIGKYVINEDLTIDAEGDVTINDKNITEIPIQFGIISGEFSCANCSLINLNGCPQVVGGSFYAYNNRLETLEGGPIKVNDTYSVSQNRLTSLEHCPEHVGGEFICSHNKLTKLRFSPKTVGGDFNCNNNPIEQIWDFKCDIKEDFCHSGDSIIGLEKYYAYSNYNIWMTILSSTKLNSILNYHHLTQEMNNNPVDPNNNNTKIKKKL